MRTSAAVTVALAAAATPMVMADSAYERRELYDLVARAATAAENVPADQQGSQAFGLFSLLGHGLEGIGNLIDSKNKKSRDLGDIEDIIARHLPEEHEHEHERFRGHEHEHERFRGHAHKHFHGHEQEHEHGRFRHHEHEHEHDRFRHHAHEHELEHRPSSHFREHEHERFHRPGRFAREVPAAPAQESHAPAQAAAPAPAQQNSAEHPAEHRHKHKHGKGAHRHHGHHRRPQGAHRQGQYERPEDAHRHQGQFEHPQDAQRVQAPAPGQQPTEVHRQAARELVDLLTREDQGSEAFSLGSIFKIGKDIFHAFDHHNSSRRAIPEEY